MRRVAMLMAFLIAIPLLGTQPAQAAYTQVTTTNVNCRTGQTVDGCGQSGLGSSPRSARDNRNCGLNTGTLPPGISFIPARNQFDGTFSTAGTWTFTETWSLFCGGDRTQYVYNFTITTPPVTPVVDSTLTHSATVGVSMATYTISGTNSPTSYSATGLPTGLSVNLTNGQIAGTPTGVGTFNVTINAINGGGTGSATLVITVSKGTQSALTLASTTATYGSAFSLESSGGSGTGAVSFSLSSAGTAGCSLLTSTSITSTSAGTCTLTVSKAADTNYNAASSSVPVIVARAIQAPLTLSPTVSTFGVNLTLTFTGGSGLGSVTYVVTDAGTAGCSISGTTLTSTGGGTCSVTVSKALDTNYNAISSTATTVTIAARPQLLPVEMDSLAEMTFGSPLTLTASGGSGTGAFSFGVVDPGTANCSIVGTQLTTSGDVGSDCVVRATKAADISNLVRDSDSQRITVSNKAAQPTLSVTPPAVAYQTSMTLSTVGGAGTGGVTFLVTDPGTADCSIVSGRLHSTGNVGTTCKVTATKATSKNYLVASSAELSVTVTDKSVQSITFTAPSNRAYAVPAFTVAPFSDSGLAVAVTSSTPLICTVSGLDVSMHLPGTCMLTANQSGDGNHLGALPVARSFEVTRAVQTVTWNPLVGVASTSSPVTMSTAIGSDGGTVTYSVLDQGTTNCMIADPNLPIVTFNAAGACTIQAEADVTDTHLSGTSLKILMISVPAPIGGPAAVGGSTDDASLSVVAVRSLDPIRAHAGLLAGDDRVVVDGKRIPARIEANATNTGLDVLGVNWRIEIVSLGADGSPIALAPGGVLSLTAGAKLRVSGSGFEELAQVRLYLLNRTLLLGSLMTDRSGDFDGELRIPVDVASGVDTLQINGFTTDRMVRSFSLGISVKEAQDMSTAIGSRIYFRYKSAVLTTKAKKSLVYMLSQLPEGATVKAAILGSMRSKGATYADRRLANRRTAAVQTFLKSQGFTGHVFRSIRRVTVPKGYLERRVYVTLK